MRSVGELWVHWPDVGYVCVWGGANTPILVLSAARPELLRSLLSCGT